ncbi:MAG: YlbF family regulator [Clostridia bacterium]|nr:YlbF family regulator [Clostridia bacterium]
MGILEATRALGKEMQKDERFIAFAKAKLANDNDEQLQKDIGEFNIVRMNLEKETGAEQVNEEKVKELNEELRSIYTKIMSSKTMVDYNNAKAGLDAMLNDINSVIMQCALGADPETCEPEHECSGSCSTCGGCH